MFLPGCRRSGVAHPLADGLAHAGWPRGHNAQEPFTRTSYQFLDPLRLYFPMEVLLRQLGAVSSPMHKEEALG
jgi:hypothetical protein